MMRKILGGAVLAALLAIIGCARKTPVLQLPTAPVPIHRETASPTPPADYLGRDASNDIPIPLNPLRTFNGKTKAEIYQIRTVAVNQYPRLMNFFVHGYKPSDAIFGRIEDGKPWWGILGLSYYGNGDKSILGESWHSEYILNPYLLVAINHDGVEVMRDPPFPPEDLQVHATSLTLNLKERWGMAAFNISGPYQRSEQLGYSYRQRGNLNLYLYNARDLGFHYMYVSTNDSSGIAPAHQGNDPIELVQYFHTGGSCGYPGGCNNMSPTVEGYFEHLDRLPAVLAVKLWREKPPQASDPPDFWFLLKLN